jgi:hypothetical protein
MKLKESGVTINRSKKPLFTQNSIDEKKGELFVRATSRNSNILHASETYKQRASALKNILAAAKIYAGILNGETCVVDENGSQWVVENGKFVNATNRMVKGWKDSVKEDLTVKTK